MTKSSVLRRPAPAHVRAALLIILLSPGALTLAGEVARVAAPLGASDKRGLDEMALGDAAYRERRDPQQAEAALRHYRTAFQQRPNDAQAAWRVGMAAYFMGQRIASTSNDKQRYWIEGRDAAQDGTDLDPNCAPCHFWTAINMALYGDSVGVLKMLFTLRTIRRHLERSLALDPTYAFGGAHRVLGTIDRKLPGLLGGSKRSARAHFEAAIAGSPDEPLNYLFLAELLANDLKDRQGAIAAARRGLQVPPLPSERVEAIDCLVETRQFLARLGAPPDSAPVAGQR